MSNYKIAGIGEILWDVLPTGKELGGAPANFAYHATMLGANGYIVSAVGKDDLGTEIISRLAKTDIQLELNISDYPTGIVNVTLNKEGIPCYEIKEEVAWDHISISEESASLAVQLDAVCFGSLAQRSKESRASIAKFVDLVPENALKIFDINLRQRYYSPRLIDESMSLANILKINKEELIVVAEMFGLNGDDLLICRYLVNKYRLKMLACTYGAEGSLLCSMTESSFMQTPKIEVKDSIGAGDAFTAALVIGILNNLSIDQCHRLAVEIASYVCTQGGAMPFYSNEIKQIKNSYYKS